MTVTDQSGSGGEQAESASGGLGSERSAAAAGGLAVDRLTGAEGKGLGLGIGGGERGLGWQGGRARPGKARRRESGLVGWMLWMQPPAQ